MTEILYGAQITVRLLERQRVQCVAGYPGGAVLPLYDALSQSQSIRHILGRHEQACGFIAQGTARVSGQPGVCLATSGPGATNLLTAVADAMMDSIPLIAITGQVARAMIGTDAFQEVDSYGLSIPVTKHSYLVSSAKELLAVIPQAFTIAMSGRPGAVWIDIPKDVQTEMIEVDKWPEPGGPVLVDEADEALLLQAMVMIEEARRPVIYAGGGIVHSGGALALREFAERTGIPVATTMMGLGTIPTKHPLSLGLMGQHGAAYIHQVLDICDLLIAVGCRFDDRVTGKLSAFCPRASIIHIDIDPAELGKIKQPHLSISADAAGTLNRLTHKTHLIQRKEWLAQVDSLRAENPPHFPGMDDIDTHYGLIHAVAKAAPNNSIIVTDVGQHQMWVAQSYPSLKPRAWLTSGGFGTMGFGVPTAIGAALAKPERTVICFTGDGSILMNIQELVTAAELKVNLKIIVMDNSALGLVRQQQSLFYGQRLFASELHAKPDFASLAEAMGIRAVELDTEVGPASALSDALAQPGPCLIHAHIDEEEMVLPMVPPGAANLETIGAGK